MAFIRTKDMKAYEEYCDVANPSTKTAYLTEEEIRERYSEYFINELMKAAEDASYMPNI